MYSTNSSIQWLRYVLIFHWCAVFVTQETTLGDHALFELQGPQISGKIERDGVWPESPGSIFRMVFK